MISESLILEQIRRVSPSRYVAMKACLLREVWTASGNTPLLPPSPLAELGTIIHRLLEEAGRCQLDGGANGKIDATWEALVLQAEEKMEKSTLRKHLVPLCKSIHDFEVRKLRACRRTAEIARAVSLLEEGPHKPDLEPAGFELWVESQDGLVGGYIDRVMRTKDGAILSDYKSGAILDCGMGEGSCEIKREYKEQLKLYAALYRLKYGAWPILLQIVPLQGKPVEVVFGPEESERLLAEAITLLHVFNMRIAEVQNGRADIFGLATPAVLHCRICLFRPACRAYSNARKLNPQEKWPADVRGILREKIRLRNGKLCMRIVEGESSSLTIVTTVRNLTGSADRHPSLDLISEGDWLELYGLRDDYRSGDYFETQNTVIFGKG